MTTLSSLATKRSYGCVISPCPIMEPVVLLTAVLPCTHLRMCRFLSSGSARNPPADSAGTGRHWSSSCPLPTTAPISLGWRTSTMWEKRYFKKNIGVRKSQLDPNVAPTWLPLRIAHAQWASWRSLSSESDEGGRATEPKLEAHFRHNCWGKPTTKWQWPVNYRQSCSNHC